MAGERGRGQRLGAVVVREEAAAARAGWKSLGSLKKPSRLIALA